MTVTAISQVREESLSSETMLALASGGDASKLTPGQRLAYVKARCDAAGLDPITHPFEFTNLNGKLILYAKKAATDGLCAKHSTSITIPSAKTEDGVYTVIAHASDPSGRHMEDMGCVWVDGLKGNDLANARMKATTKAKRRTVLSMYGLGMLDETELESIPRAHPVAVEAEVVEAPKAAEPPPKSAAKALPAPHVAALWARLMEYQGGNKALADAALKRAATEVFGENPPPTKEWSVDNAKAVAMAIWPDDLTY